MAEIFKQLYSLHIVNYIGVEDFADRLSFLYTATLLTVCCTASVLRAYMMNPITCFLPNIFGSFHEEKDLRGQLEFANNYCWSEGTYAVGVKDFKIDGTSPSGGLEVFEDRKINFYQWVPFVLALQALCFYLPRVIWHGISFGRAGTDVGHIVKVARDAGRADAKKHSRLLGHACRMIEQMLDRQSGKMKRSDDGRLEGVRRVMRKCMGILMPSRFIGSGLILTYLVIKLAYLGNTVGQLVLMQYFLQLNSTKYSLLGVHLLADIVRGRDWHNTMVFPRVGCCAIFIRSAAGGNWQLSQCSLPINMIYEKIYIFLWFWFIFVGLATFVSIFAWIWRLRNASMSSRFVRKYLKLADNYQELKKSGQVKGFLRNFLHRDGAFLMKMISLNCGDLICSEIIQSMWQRYKKEKGLPLSQDEVEQPDRAVLKLSCKNLPVSAEVPDAATVANSEERALLRQRRKMSRQKSLPLPGTSRRRQDSAGSGTTSAATVAEQKLSLQEAAPLFPG